MSAAVDAAYGLAAALRAGTAAMHARAERSGVVADILAGHATHHGHALLLRNLLPVYEAIETGLQTGRDRLELAGIADPALFRAEFIASDLAAAYGAHWRRTLELLPAGARYAQRVARATAGDGSRLIAHAYVRYLGDLSGGQGLQRLLTRQLALPASALRFYQFSAITDAKAFKDRFRAALDAAGGHLARPQDVVREASVAFRLNIAVAEAVQMAAD